MINFHRTLAGEFLVRLMLKDCAGGHLKAAEDSPRFKILFPHWQNEYAAALLEPEREKLFERVTAAETAIYKRLQQISQDPDHQAERRVIDRALADLRVLKRDKLGFPDWEKK